MIALVPDCPLIVKFIVPLLASANAKVIVPTEVAVMGPTQGTVGEDPPDVLYNAPVQPLPETAQLDATYQTGLPLASYVNIVTKMMPYCWVNETPHPDSLAFHHRYCNYSSARHDRK